MIRALLLLLVLLAVSPLDAAWAQDCAECLERKRSACASECKLVGPEDSVRCQKDCAWQYCTHRCSESDPALLSEPYKNCESCLDQQFNLCEANCPTGTDRLRAMCKLGCAKQRCTSWCAQ